MQTVTAPPAPHRAGPRIAPIVAGSLLALLASVALALGATGLWAASKEDDQGYISTDAERYTASTRAIATDDLELDDVPEDVNDVLGRLRLQVTSRSGEDVFVGIARSADVRAYLAGSPHTTLTDVDYSPFEPTYRDNGGDRAPAPPQAQDFWATSARGPGRQTLTWDVEEGSWTAVVMNADGSPGVDADVSAGVRLPWLTTAAWGATGGGLLALLAAAGLIYAGVRTPRPRATA